MRRMWHVWPGQLWPALPDQEQAFQDRLRELAGTAGPFSRDDVSSVIGILRCGGDIDASLAFAPGLRLPALLGAYEALAGALRDCFSAWGSLVACTAPAEVLRYADAASLILPVPVHRALYALEESPENIGSAFASLASQVSETVFAARAIEDELRAVRPPSPMGVEIGSKLYSSTVPGAYSDPFYCPDRVAALSPVRVSDLLSRCSLLPS